VSRELVTMPTQVSGRRNSQGSSSSWADVPWTKGGNNLDRLPCLLDHVVLEGVRNESGPSPMGPGEQRFKGRDCIRTCKTARRPVARLTPVSSLPLATDLDCPAQNLPIALKRVARMRSLTVASGGGLAFPSLDAYAVFPAPSAPSSNECGILASTPEPVGPPVVLEAESASILRVSWEYDALAAPVTVTAR
jgi:hypothetical protein